jgi:hypothetical protein
LAYAGRQPGLAAPGGRSRVIGRQRTDTPLPTRQVPTRSSSPSNAELSPLYAFICARQLFFDGEGVLYAILSSLFNEGFTGEMSCGEDLFWDCPFLGSTGLAQRILFASKELTWYVGKNTRQYRTSLVSKFRWTHWKCSAILPGTLNINILGGECSRALHMVYRSNI